MQAVRVQRCARLHCDVTLSMDLVIMSEVKKDCPPVAVVVPAAPRRSVTILRMSSSSNGVMARVGAVMITGPLQ